MALHGHKKKKTEKVAWKKKFQTTVLARKTLNSLLQQVSKMSGTIKTKSLSFFDKTRQNFCLFPFQPDQWSLKWSGTDVAGLQCDCKVC